MAAIDGGQRCRSCAFSRTMLRACGRFPLEAGWNQIAADWRLMIDSGSALGIRDAAGRWIASCAGPAARPGHRRGSAWCWSPSRSAARARHAPAAALHRYDRGRRPFHGPRCHRVRPPDLPAARFPRRLSAVALERGPPIAQRALRRRPASRSGRDAATTLQRIASYDRQRSGLRARRGAGASACPRPGVAHVAERGDGSVAGYSLGRDGHHATHIGPIVAEDEATGLALLSRALAACDGPAILDVPDQHETIRHWLHRRGPRHREASCACCAARRPAVEDGSRIFALAGPELA